MPRVDVQSEASVISILQSISARLRNWEGVWDRVEKRLPDLSVTWWDRRFNLPLHHSPETLRQRGKGLGNPVRSGRRRKKSRGGYYDRNRPTSGTTRAHPYWQWTGSLRRSTEKFTTTQSLRARIDMARNYKGPLSRSKLTEVLGKFDASGAKGWNTKAMEAALDTVIQDWLSEDVLEGLA